MWIVVHEMRRQKKTWIADKTIFYYLPLIYVDR